MKRTLVVACPDWPVHAARPIIEEATGHTGHEQPVAVWSHRGIVATNPAARAVGVRVGLRRREAQGRCPELVLVAVDESRDARCFEPVATALGTISPQVEIVEPGVAAMATRGPSRYFGGDVALADRVRQVVSDAAEAMAAGGMTVRVGVADGPLVARLAARRADSSTPCVVAPGTSASFLAPIPVSAIVDLVDDPRPLATWDRLGLHTLGDVAALPTTAVLGRFGEPGMWVHSLARGSDPTASVPTPLPDDVDEVIDFDPPEMRADAVAFVARGAAEAFNDRLGTLGLSCAQVTITLSTDHGEQLERRWRLDGPGRIGEHGRSVAMLIAERVRWQTDGWLSASPTARPSAGIIRVTFAPGEVRPARGLQQSLWGGASANDERAARAVARLEALSGPDAVCAVRLKGGRDPIDEATLVPTATVGIGPGRSVAGAIQRHRDAPWPGRLPSPAPATVAASPRPIRVLDPAGKDVLVNGRGELIGVPTTLWVDRTDGKPGRPVGIADWVGPWPVEERWWDTLGRQRRARLQLVTTQGIALLVTRHHRSWWLTATYT